MFSDMNNFNKEIELLKKLKKASVLDAGRKEQLKQNIMQQIAAPEPATAAAQSPAPRSQRLWSVLRYGFSAALGISLVAGTAFASNSAKPGDPLFPVKKLKENIQVTLTTNDQAKADLQSEIAEDRLHALIEIKSKDQTAASTGTPPNQGQTAASQTAVQSSATVQANPKLEHEAAEELTNAVNHLRETQRKLRQRGNTQAAASIDNTIMQLQQQAQIDLGETQNQDGGHDNDGRGDSDHQHNQNGTAAPSNTQNETNSKSNSGRNHGGNDNDNNANENDLDFNTNTQTGTTGQGTTVLNLKPLPDNPLPGPFNISGQTSTQVQQQTQHHDDDHQSGSDSSESGGGSH